MQLNELCTLFLLALEDLPIFVLTSLLLYRHRELAEGTAIVSFGTHEEIPAVM